MRVRYEERHSSPSINITLLRSEHFQLHLQRWNNFLRLIAEAFDKIQAETKPNCPAYWPRVISFRHRHFETQTYWNSQP